VSGLEWTAVGFGIAYVVLAIRQSPWCWPAGLVSVGIYIVVFGRARLYGDAGLSVLYAILSVHGWWCWRHPQPGRTELPVTRVSRREAAILGTAAVAALPALRALLAALGGALPGPDAVGTVLSLAAQWLTNRKKLENWLLWIAADLLFIAIYVAKDLRPTAGLYMVYTVLAGQGYRAWRRTLEPA
jgi:nicotinamide mononucleotide transporter